MYKDIKKRRCPAGNALGVQTRGYVEDLCKTFMRKKLAQIEKKSLNLDQE